MTYRIYAIIGKQRVKDKTTTESRTVADFALAELLRDNTLNNVKVSMTERKQHDKKATNIAFYDMTNTRVCSKCNFVGEFIDDGETCPKCMLVQ